MEKQQLTTKSLRQFLDQKDLGLLEDPITFVKTDKFKGLLCCTGCINCWASMWVTACFCPISVFCPGTTFKHYGLKLDKTSVQMSDAVNDCCCHVATAQKTVPLDKIQDVQLTESCLLTCFGLKQVNVQTAADGGTGASEVGVAFLEHPEEAREAIQLAVKLHQQAHTAPAQAAMSRGGSSMAARLQRLKDMEAKGWLSEKEASQAKVPLLAAEGDPTLRLWEAGELLGKGLVTQEEFNRVKSAIISQISKH